MKEIVSGGVGRQMNNRDRVWLARITQVALEKTPTGAVTEWSNPDSEIKGTISPLSTFRSDQAKSCREFQQTVSFGGVTEIAYGVACRQKDGSWKIVK
ncbi:MAG: RT0821/Lpp0805 family surface protein [bacterium]